MIYKIYSVYDSKVECFLQPFFMRSRGEAIRGFTELCNDNSTNFGKYPSDFTLFELGEYVDSNCKFVMLDTPHSLGLATEFKSPHSSDLS